MLGKIFLFVYMVWGWKKGRMLESPIYWQKDGRGDWIFERWRVGLSTNHTGRKTEKGWNE
eukprot:1371073-Amorphochlora_amoeboformis.AAC.1